MKKLLLSLSVSLAVLPVYADEMTPTPAQGVDLPPARAAKPEPGAAPAQVAPAEALPQASPAAESPLPRAAVAKPAAAAAEAAPAARPARADKFGWYAGAGGGWSSFNGNEVDLAPGLASETYTLTKLDDDSTAWKVFGGYQFNKNWAAELAYTDLGKFSFEADVSAGPFATGTEYGKAKPACWSLSAVGILPVGNNFSLLGKAGICRWDDHARVVYPATGTIEPVESTGTDLTFGLGAKYDASRNLGVRAEWERFNNVVHDRSSVDLWSLSLQYSF